IQALAPTPSGHGYWLVAGDGGIFSFGDAGYFGTGAGKTDKRVIDIAATVTGRGYYLVTSNGQVFPFGDATGYGDASKANLSNRITAMSVVNPSAARPSGAGGLAAVDDSAAGNEDAPINIDVLGNDRPPAGGGPLALQSITPPEHGRAQIVENRVAYEPDSDYHGPDSFTYTVTDTGGGSATGTVHLDLAPVDDRPAAVDDAVGITDGGPTTIDVVANDRGLGDGLKSVEVVQPPAHGQAVVQPDQKIGYTPAGGFKGTDTLQYRVTDTDDESSTAKVSITLGGVNHVPVAVDDNLTTRSGRTTLPLDVTANDDVADGAREVRFAGPDGAPTDAADITTPAGGIARRSGTRVTYTAPAGAFAGSDSFPYVVVDNDGEVSRPATVRASVVANKAPQVKDGTVNVPEGRQAVGSIAKLGWDPEKDAITFSLRSSPAGQLTLKPDGGFLYQAPAGVDVDAFSFVVNDGNSDSSEGHLSIQITQAQATTASSTTTTGPSASPASSTTTTTRRSPTTATTGKSSSTTTTAKSSTSQTTGKTSASSSSTKQKKAAGSNNHGKSPPSGTTSTTSGSSSPSSGTPAPAGTAPTKAMLLPMLPLAAVPAVARHRRRRRRRR
ncbi:MAG TPA: Ig-like domain-containing protein, partial [Acidimicrobiia bacterium]|nr:Ig-like domain-containing protein [Acidimicrobiia bacterium]